MVTFKSKHTLFKKQVQYMKSPARYTIYSGAVRAGKTVPLCYRVLYLSAPGKVQLLACPSYKMLSRVVLPVLQDILSAMPPRSFTYHKSDQTLLIHYPGLEDSITYLSHLQDPYSIQGMTLDHYHLDEATAGISEETFLMLNSRLSKEGASGSITTNPGPLSHYLYTFFNEFDPERNNQQNKKVIMAKTIDNKHLPQSYIDDLLTRPKSWKDRYMDGKWGILEGSIYDDFRRDIHSVEFEINSDWEFYLAIDFGYKNPFACLVVGIDNDGRAYVCEEYYEAGRTIDRNAYAIKENFLNRYDFVEIICDEDPNAKRQLEEITGLMTTYKTRYKKVLSGIDSVKKALVVQGDGLPRLFIHPTCHNLIREMESYSWEQDKASGVHVEKPVKKDDHGCDALRYLIYSREL